MPGSSLLGDVSKMSCPMDFCPTTGRQVACDSEGPHELTRSVNGHAIQFKIGIYHRWASRRRTVPAADPEQLMSIENEMGKSGHVCQAIRDSGS